MANERIYLALGDSMSIDDYTGVKGGGAVNQFFRSLGSDWSLDDRTFDGCQMAGVPRDGEGEVVTLTIGGNDLLWNKDQYLSEGVADFAAEHLALLRALRKQNPNSLLIVGDIYGPAAPLTDAEAHGLAEANQAIQENCREVGAQLATIHEAFQGREDSLLCLGIEPTLKGAEVIAGLFAGAMSRER